MAATRAVQKLGISSGYAWVFPSGCVSSITVPGASDVAPEELVAARRRIYFLHLSVHLLWRYRNRDCAFVRRGGPRSLRGDVRSEVNSDRIGSLAPCPLSPR